MKRVLILGGNGFLGKNLNEILIQKWDNEKNCGYDYEKNIIYFLQSRITGLDLTDYELTFQKIKAIKPHVIINLAAHVGSLKYVSENAGDVITDNALMYINLYKAISKINSEIVVINTLANCSYPGTGSVQHEKNWWNGEIHESVLSFGGSRKFGYLVSKCFETQYKVKTVNLIMPNAYGPNDYLDEEKTHAMNGIVMRMIKAQRNGDKKFVVWGSGTPVREWIYMPDMARIIKKVIDEEMFDLPNPINIGQQEGVSIGWCVNQISILLDYDTKFELDTSKPDGAPIKVLSSKLFEKHFKDFNFTSYTDGLNATIKYYKENL